MPPNRRRSVLAEREGTTPADAFAVQLVHRLRDQDPRITPALTWLDQHLAAQGTTADAVVRDEHQRQGAANVTVRNIITSMRLISDVDWTELFERVSLVDDVLAAGSAFRDMDFPTRNLYRSAIEELARGADRTELEVARAAVAGGEAGIRATPRVEADRRGDPGYHLLADGRQRVRGGDRLPAAAERLARTPDPAARHRRLRRRRRARSRRSSSPSRCRVCTRTGLGPMWLGLLGVLGLIPAIDAAVALVNRAVTRGFGATLLPALELRDGVPRDCARSSPCRRC